MLVKIVVKDYHLWVKKLPLFFHCKRVIDVQNCGRVAWYSRQRKYGILKRFSEDKCSLRMNEVKFWIEFWYAAHRGGKKRKSDDSTSLNFSLRTLYTATSLHCVHFIWWNMRNILKSDSMRSKDGKVFKALEVLKFLSNIQSMLTSLGKCGTLTCKLFEAWTYKYQIQLLQSFTTYYTPIS